MRGEANDTSAARPDPRQGGIGKKFRRLAAARNRIHAGKATRGLAGIAALAISAALFYRVRELLAALLLFSILFGVVIAVVFILWLIEEGAHKAAVEVEHHLPNVARRGIPPAAGNEARHTSGSGWS